ncbi:PH domain-containing protein [Marinactinospora thermotolerans]|uniref:PH domain-containing protein n=1 Tax=Marinactinospora thermotolerans TaxID=531310 RepID=UPI003D9104A4
MRPFTQPLPRVLGWVWIAIVAVNLVDLALRGRTYAAVVAAALLVFSVGVTYVLALRPKVVATEEGVRVVNPLREAFIPWQAFTWADVTDVLRVHAGDRVFRSWPLRETKRAKVRDNLRRADGYVELAEEDPRRMRPVDFVARQLRDEAEKRKARPLSEQAEPTVVWSPDAIVALGAPAFLLVAALLFA